MANPNQPRDARGRFSRTLSADSKRDLAERDRDRKRLEKARREAAREEVKSEIASVGMLLDKLRKVKPRRSDDVHENVEWEQQWAAARERNRRLRAKLRAI